MLVPPRFAKVPTTLLLALATLLASACGEKIEAVCEKKCGSDAEKCKESGEKAEATAEERGCEAEFEGYVGCAEEKGTCTNGVLEATDPCAAEIKALAACVQ